MSADSGRGNPAPTSLRKYFGQGSGCGTACFICGVGGWDTAMTLAIFFGLSSLGFIFLFLWALVTKQFKDTNSLSDEPLKAEDFADQKTKGEFGNANG